MDIHFHNDNHIKFLYLLRKNTIFAYFYYYYTSISLSIIIGVYFIHVLCFLTFLINMS